MLNRDEETNITTTNKWNDGKDMLIQVFADVWKENKDIID